MKRIVVLAALILPLWAAAQAYRPVEGWPKETNERVEAFLEQTRSVTERKVAVFDGDGTVFGQVPHYLADEALYRYAERAPKDKLAILERMVKDGNNVGKPYVEDRAHFLAGMTPEAVAELGDECFRDAYANKFYPEMKQFIANLKAFGFEVWILTASPEFLYQKFMSEQLHIPEVNVIGMKSVVVGDVLTDQIVLPVPQDDGKANVIPTFIKTTPLIVGGNSRGDQEMLDRSAGLKIVVNPEPTVREYWERDPRAVIVYSNDVRDPDVKFSTAEWGIRENVPHPKN